MEIKTKIKKWDIIKLKSVCTTKVATNKVKREHSEWERILARETIEKLISKIYKKLIQLNTIKANNPIKKWERDQKRYFSKEYIQMANKHMKRCSTPSIIQFSSVAQLCPTICDPMSCTTPTPGAYPNSCPLSR